MLLKENMGSILIKMAYSVSISSLFLPRLAWGMANLCKWTPYPPFNDIKVFIPYMNKMLCLKNSESMPIESLRTSNLIETVVHALWGLSYITRRTDKPIKELAELINLKTICELITHKVLEVATPALHIIGHICCGDEEDVDMAIASNCLPSLAHIILLNNHPSLIEISCWVLSSIAAGPSRHIEAILGFVLSISQLCIKSNNYKV